MVNYKGDLDRDNDLDNNINNDNEEANHSNNKNQSIIKFEIKKSDKTIKLE